MKLTELQKKYFTIGTETNGKNYLKLRNDIYPYYCLDNLKLSNKINDLIKADEKGLYYKGFKVCFTYKNKTYYISHHHQNDDFIKDLIELLKYNCAYDIYIIYGELD